MPALVPPTVLLLPLCVLSAGPIGAAAPPAVVEDAVSITITFPGSAALRLVKAGGRVRGIRWLELNGRRTFSLAAPDVVAPPSIEITDSCRWSAPSSWRHYLGLRATNRGLWVSRGGCRPRIVELARASYVRTTIDGGVVSVLFRTTDGPVAWQFVGRTDTVGGDLYRGLGWRLQTAGMPGAVRAHFRQPIPLGRDEWLLAQRWGGFVEERLHSGTRFGVEPTILNAFWQPFSFVAGSKGARLGWFERPTAARMAIERDGPFLVRALAIPFGKGPQRTTPFAFLEASTAPLADPWARRNAWTAAYDAVAELYRARTGIQPVDPLPTYLWATAPEKDYDAFVYGGRPTTPWLQRFAKDLPRLARLGLAEVHLQSPWHSDAEHAIDERVDLTNHDGRFPPRERIGSGHAPWDQTLSRVNGGQAELARFTDHAHDLGLRVVLWTNLAHLSISSPWLDEHPDWPMWTVGGVPHDEGYGDITGTSLRSGFRDELIERLSQVRDTTGVDGVFLDSFLTFGVATDYSRSEPRPQLTESLDLVREIQARGLRDVSLEGVGVLGLSTGGYGYEATAYLGRPHPEELARFRAIQGREYGLYRYVADTFLEPESYYRALASKGVMAVFDLRQFDDLDSEQQARIVRANFEYLFVRPWMQRRLLLGRGATWQGVAYRRDGAKEVVLFAFEPFDMALPGTWEVHDLTAHRLLVVENRLRAEPWHTYLAQPR